MATNYLLDDPAYQNADQEDFTNWGNQSYDLLGGGNTNLGATSDLLSTSNNALTSPDFTFGGSYASENLGGDNSLNNDNSEFLSGANYSFGGDTPDPVDTQAESNGFLNGVKGAMSTVDGWFRSLLGGEAGAQKFYSGAIMAGAQAILQSSQNDDVIKFRNADREDTQSHQKELIADKNAREDEARARKNSVSTRAGLLKYQPNFGKNFQVPGAANTQQYGILGSK